MVAIHAKETLKNFSHATIILVQAQVTKYLNILVLSKNKVVSLHLSADCTWSRWGEWGTCTKTCDGGVQLRSRIISQQAKEGGAPCKPLSTEMQACNVDACPSGFISTSCLPILSIINLLLVAVPVDCEWSSWGAWTACSEKCGGGTKLKTRIISKPAQNGGKSCLGTSSREISCNSNLCPKPSKGNHISSLL